MTAQVLVITNTTSGRRLEDKDRAPYLIQLSRRRTFCSPVSPSSVLICVVEGRPLFAIQCAVTHVIRCCAGKLSARKKHVG